MQWNEKKFAKIIDRTLSPVYLWLNIQSWALYQTVKAAEDYVNSNFSENTITDIFLLNYLKIQSFIYIKKEDNAETT